MTDVPAQIRFQMRFEHYGSPPNYRISVCDHLDRTFGGRYIGRSGINAGLEVPIISCLLSFISGVS